MEYKYPYKNLAERQAQIKIAEGKGLTMLHDDFDPDWKLGDEPHGTMTFTDVMPPESPPPEPPRDFGAEIDEIKAKIADYDDLKVRVEKLEKK